MKFPDKKILIIDDEINWADFFKNTLSKQGYKFVEAKYGVDKFSDLLGYDLVILDIKMPRFNGFEVKEYLKTNSTETKIILMSQFEDFGLDLLDKAKGADGWLKKKTLEKNEWEIIMLVNDVLCKNMPSEMIQNENSKEKISININVANELGIRTPDQAMTEALFSELSKIIKIKDKEYGKNHIEDLNGIREELTKEKKDKNFINTALEKINNTIGQAYNIANHINKIIELVDKSMGF